jgi:hypothetical protein
MRLPMNFVVNISINAELVENMKTIKFLIYKRFLARIDGSIPVKKMAR